ncbi:phage portal protein [Kitasatospora sp. NPDC058201]|uniref:phage portal protein n=1 Tax=unclassified Kitasatospora TaxID=2633591 RepID=UPI00365B5ED6
MDLRPEEWLQLLLLGHQEELPQLQELNRFYEGCQPLAYLHPELLAELGEQMQQVVINWPRLVVDAVEERLDVTGFRLPDAEGGDKEMWRVWKANGMAGQSQKAHVEGLVMRRSFVFVGANRADSDTPLITAESPLQVHADYDPATRQERAVVKRYNDVDPLTGAVRDQLATLKLPNATHHYEFKGRGGWLEVDRDEHKLGVVPVVTLANRGRLLVPGGVTELADVLPISNAACKIATDMMVGSEFHAMPRRWALGFDQEDFTDPDGKPVSVWSRLAGRIWATAKNRKDDGVEVGQFPEADLKNFHSTIELLARITAALAALPPNYMGLSADDAASDAAIRSREARLVKRAERKCGSLGDGYEQMQRLVRRFQTGGWDPALLQLETLWANPATPTYAQKADAATKLVGAGILPIEQAWEDLGYSSAQQARMRQMQADALTRSMGGDLAALIGPKPGPEVDPVPGG